MPLFVYFEGLYLLFRCLYLFIYRPLFVYLNAFICLFRGLFVYLEAVVAQMRNTKRGGTQYGERKDDAWCL